MSVIFLRQLCNSKISAILAPEILLKDLGAERLPRKIFLKYCQNIFEVTNQNFKFLPN